MRVLQRVEQLHDFPKSSWKVQEDKSGTYRELIVGNYRVVYRGAWLLCSRSLVLREAGFRGSAWFSVQQDFEVDETEPGGICHIVAGTNLSFLFHARLTIIGLLERDLMSTIHKQLVTDEEGRPVGVLIPYEEWLRIEQQLGGAAGANGIEQLRRHEGMIRLSEDPVAYQRRLRDEWA